MPTIVNPLFEAGCVVFFCLRDLLADFGSGEVLLLLTVNGDRHFLNFDGHCYKSGNLKAGSFYVSL